MANFANYGNLETVLTGYANKINNISEVVPSDATSSNKLVTQSDLPSSDPYDGRKIRYTISVSNWSSSPNSDGYYTYSLTLTKPLSTNTSPNVYIAGSTDNTEPTATENTMFSYVKRCNLSSSTTLVLYASTKPTSTFYVFVGAEGGSVNHSTTEQDTGLTWIDGKKIYQKTYSLTLTNNNPQTQTGYFADSYWDGLETSDKVAETIVGVDIVYTYVEPNDNLTYTKTPSPHTLDAWVQRARHNAVGLSLNAFHWYTGMSGATVYFTVRYTKV